MKLTMKQYVQRLKEKENNSLFPIEEYKGSDINIWHKCNICHTKYFIKPHNLMYTKKKMLGCLKCAPKHGYFSKNHESYVKTLKEKEINDIFPIEEYITNRTYILHKCNICGHIKMRTPFNVLTWKKSGCSNCNNGNNNKTIGPIKKHDEYLRELKNKKNNYIFPLEKYKGCSTPILHECRKCGFKWKTKPSDVLIRNTNGCQKCYMVEIGKNDLWTTHPEIAALFVNPEDGYKYTAGSQKKVVSLCPSCKKYTKELFVTSFVRSGFKCPICSDGFSMPEKFISNFLMMNNIENFKHNRETEWSNKKRYDFIINNNIIIETHGSQHYEKNSQFSLFKSLEKQKEIDVYKKELALNNGIEYYIELDCRISSLNHFKYSIINSNISKILNITIDNFNWEKCYIKSLKSKMIEAVEMYHNDTTIKEIALKLKVTEHTIQEYIKKLKGII